MHKNRGRRAKLSPEDQRKFNEKTIASLKRLLSYLSDYKISLLIILFCSLVGTIFEVIGPYMMGNTTNYVVTTLSQDKPIVMEDFMYYIYLLVGMYFLAYIFSFISLRLVSKVRASIVFKMKEDISKKMKKLPISYFDKNPVGDLLSRMTNDIQTVGDSLDQIIKEMFSSLVLVVGVLGVMFYISPILTLVALVIVPLVSLFNIKILQESQKTYTEQWKDLGDLNSHIEEMFSSNNLVKAYNYEEESQKDFEIKNEKLSQSASKAEFLSGITIPVSMFVNNIGLVAISILGAYFVLIGRINIGNFQSFLQYAKKYTRPIIGLTQVLSILQGGIAASERIFEVLDAEEEKLRKDLVSIDGLKSNVKFENISFGYTDEKVIKNLDIDIKAGSTVAIVGPTGSGKTTLVNLLMRFYDVDQGAIKIDGVDIRNFARSDLRNYLAMVLQDTWLFEGTIYDNIAYGREDATREEVIQASKNAYAHDFILNLPQEYDTILEGNASNISEGQKQLLTIARGLIANPQILILDEATSSIDTRTERLIQQAMARLVEGRTSFVIAHRLSTIVKADLILVIKDGDIIEKGNHQELLKKRGFYYELYFSQF